MRDVSYNIQNNISEHKILFFTRLNFLVSDIRPARKEYSKLAAEEPITPQQSLETNGNEEEQEDPTIDTRHTADLLDTDTDSSCADMDYEGHEYTDDSDYGNSINNSISAF